MGDLAYAPFLTVVRERASADACQPSLPPSIPVFISPSNSPTQYYCAASVASMLFFTICALHPVGTMTPKQFEVNSSSKKHKHLHFSNLILWIDNSSSETMSTYTAWILSSKNMTKQHEMTTLLYKKVILRVHNNLTLQTNAVTGLYKKYWLTVKLSNY